ncbi:MAG: hypothetical protein CSA50_08540 [Gammaproteobacteria bacterium]|nr:MAG: hypothetical protein CSA50_08540 [Gammaproteobacteria bacterium]
MVVFVCLFMMSLVATAADKYAVVDVRTALFASNAAKAFSEQLKRDFQGEEGKIKSVGEQAKRLQDRLKKDGAMMSENERTKVAEQFEEKAKEFNYLKSKFESSVNKRKQKFLLESKPKVDAAIRKIAKSNGVNVLFPKEATLWVDGKLDLTAQVIEELNK